LPTPHSPQDISSHDISSQDMAELRIAAQQLEARSFAMTLAQKVGMPVEHLMRLLPAGAQSTIGKAVNAALDRSLNVALLMGDAGSPIISTRRSHTVSTAITGAVGGFFGLPGLVVELPVTTTIMLHGIAEIARANGEDLRDPATALACLQVLALGPEGSPGEAMESAYYATRAALAQVTRDAATYIAQKGVTREGAPVLLTFLSRIASRFGLEVSEKAAAQLVPIAGAAGGLALNILFTQHFQKIADGHFTVRRLERKYGTDAVQEAYGRVR
jgi:hypothetical protein